jgi:hypothetical protein
LPTSYSLAVLYRTAARLGMLQLLMLKLLFVIWVRPAVYELDRKVFVTLGDPSGFPVLTRQHWRFGDSQKLAQENGVNPSVETVLD